MCFPHQNEPHTGLFNNKLLPWEISSLTAMGLEVPFDFVWAAEALATHRATIWLLSCVNSHVHFQVSHLRKALSTDLAAERFLSRMAALVFLEPAGGTATLPTYPTAVRLFPRVHLYMHMQVSNVTKSLTTNLAAEGRHVPLKGGLLMGAVHSNGWLVAHVRRLSSVGCISSSFSTSHWSSILHPNINIVLIGAVWVDWGQRLCPSVGGSVCFPVPHRTSGGWISVPVFHTLILREVGCVRSLLRVFIPNTGRREHGLWCVARAMAMKLVISLVWTEISLILNLNGNTLFMAHARTPLTSWVLSILLVQQSHWWTIWPYFNPCVPQPTPQMIVLPLSDRDFLLILQNRVLNRFVYLLRSEH